MADARIKRTEVRCVLLDGQDPMQQREQLRRAGMQASENTFRKMATEWHDMQLEGWSAAYGQNLVHRLKMDVF